MEVPKRWTEYCSGLCNYELHPDTSLFQSNQTPTQEAESLPVLREEVEEAVHSLEVGKFPEADNIPSELLKSGGGKKKKNSPDSDMQEGLGDEGIAEPLPKKGNLKQYQSYRTISLISHPSEIMLSLSSIDSRQRLRRCWEKNKLVLDQAGAQQNRSSIRVFIKKHLQHQRDLFHKFIDFKKAFDRVSHAGLRQVLRSFNGEEGLVQALHMRTPAVQSS